MKKLGKVIIIQLIIILIVILFPIKNYAEDLDSTFSSADDFLNVGDKSVNIDSEQLETSSRFIYNALLAIGIITAVIAGMILSIKYMISAADEQANIKETLVPYIISCCVIFGAFTIWKLVIKILG